MWCSSTLNVKYVYVVTFTSICFLLLIANQERGFKHLNMVSLFSAGKPISPKTEVKPMWNSSHFILREQEYISLSRGCSNCNVTCNDSVAHLKSCVDEKCLCFQSNPRINLQKVSNNSIMLSEELLPQEIIMLNDEKVLDELRLPNPVLSKIKFKSGNSFTLGDTISITLQLYDGHSHMLTRGGDDIRVTMEDKKKMFAVAGRVIDHHNGTYSIFLPTLWNATNVVTIYMPFYREERSAYLRWMRQFNLIWMYKSMFVKGNKRQATLCSPRPNIPGYDRVCNMTYENGGNTWYCGHPPSDKLTCRDVVSIEDYGFADLPILKGEEYLKRRVNTPRVFKQVTLLVKGIDKYSRPVLPPCGAKTLSKSWDLSLPSGYRHGKLYFPTYCRINQTNADIKSCLTNTTVIFTGDSTSREWYLDLVPMVGCQLSSTIKVWHRKSMCRNKQSNLIMKWVPNTMPFADIDTIGPQKRLHVKSIFTMLDEVPAKGKVIFVIHIYTHCARLHYYVFREKIRRIIPSLRQALDRNRDLVVAIKGTQTYTHKDWLPAVGDFMGPFMLSIIMEELKEFYNRVAYLDYWDMSLAYGNNAIHPLNPMKWNMMRLLFAYTCPNF